MGHTPYGYRIEDGRAVIDEEQAERVRKLYRGYLSGLALMPAAKQAGIETWHGSAKRLLQNRHYLGDAYYPAIIDRETFDKAEQELKKRAEKLGRVWEQKEEEKVTYSVDFSTKPMEKQYEDPFMQVIFRLMKRRNFSIRIMKKIQKQIQKTVRKRPTKLLLE